MLAQKPIMGWNSWNTFGKDINEQLIMEIADALVEKGYNPINQIVGYILSEDPTYITSYNNARGLIRKLDRDELMQVLVNSYLNDEKNRKEDTDGKSNDL